ncbi:hypothetical protein QOZ80_8AG0623210 [Eleusine coracana subsp. coracana]|nr:hypothetical protein QOZ80_8AG0623210 [Eleusine coracana subsp. coracana]
MATASKQAGGRGEEKRTASNGDEFTMTSNGNTFPANYAKIITLLSLPQIHDHFNPSPTDVLVASFPKSGTTWLKSICFAAARRAVHSPSGDDHPHLSRNSHDCVRSLDSLRFLEGSSDDDDADAAAPRLVGTHLPYSFGIELAGKGTPPGSTSSQPPEAKFEEAFEQFCNGCYWVGPQWEHARVLGGEQEKMLFLMYEEMLRDPAGSLRKIAAFMGCPFTVAEKEAGVVQDILEPCSIEKQRSLAVKKDGAYVVKGVLRIGNKNFFREWPGTGGTT